MNEIAKARFIDIAPELPALFAEHYKESISDKDGLEANADWVQYIKMEEAGILHCITARQDGKLRGYFISVVHPHLHHRGLLTAASDLVYLSPDSRRGTGLGLRLIRFAEKSLKAQGVKKMYLTLPKGRVSKLANRLGFRYIENVHSKWIGE